MSTERFSIREASLACGLSESCIRSWEQRYGWPAPKRHRNGYRVFSTREINQLKRVADLVKIGIPIGKIISSPCTTMKPRPLLKRL